MYADDLLLMALSITDLQKMVDLCVKEFTELDLNINRKKSLCMRIGKRHKTTAKPITIKNESLTWKSELPYLGLTLVAGNTLKFNLQNPKQKFFRATNGSFGKIGSKASPTLILSLLNSFCVPVLTYGLEAFYNSSKVRKTLDHAYSSVYCKIFNTNENSVVKSCQYHCGYMPLSFTADCYMFNYYLSCEKTDNVYLKFLFARLGRCKLNDLLRRYNLTKMTCKTYLLFKKAVWTEFENPVNVS